MASKSYLYEPTPLAKVMRPRLWLTLEDGSKVETVFGGDLVVKKGTKRERTVPEATQELYALAYSDLRYHKYIKRKPNKKDVQAKKQSDTEDDKG